MNNLKNQYAEIHIRKIKDIYFQVNEQLYDRDAEKVIRIVLNFDYNIDSREDQVSLTIRVKMVYDDAPEEVLAETQVITIFEIPSLRSVLKDDGSTLDREYLIELVSISLSHTRALLAGNLAGTPFDGVLLPVLDTEQVTDYFFPTATVKSKTKKGSKKK
jgi:hypothetical protein